MGKSKKAEPPPSFQKYGVPFYAVAWLPYKQIRCRNQQLQSQSDNDQDQDSTKVQEQEANQYYIVLAGGGGEGRSGIPNAILIAHFDLASNSLSPQPVCPSFFFLLILMLLK